MAPSGTLLTPSFAIVLVTSGFGAWSLVWAEVLGAAGYAVVSWAMLARRPGPLRQWFDRGELRPLLVAVRELLDLRRGAPLEAEPLEPV